MRNPNFLYPCTCTAQVQNLTNERLPCDRVLLTVLYIPVSSSLLNALRRITDDPEQQLVPCYLAAFRRSTPTPPAWS